jgi:hypothetical protein
MQFTIPTLDTAQRVLSATITPAVLILATGSLILTTTNRLVRVIDRVREMLPEFEKQAEITKTDESGEQKRKMMFLQLDTATTRARLVQRALTQLYLALGTFLATSIALGVIALANFKQAWIPLTLGLVGVLLLFSASVLLIVESRISMNSTYAEMDYIRSISHHHAPPDAVRIRRWWFFG